MHNKLSKLANTMHLKLQKRTVIYEKLKYTTSARWYKHYFFFKTSYVKEYKICDVRNIGFNRTMKLSKFVE